MKMLQTIAIVLLFTVLASCKLASPSASPTPKSLSPERIEQIKSEEIREEAPISWTRYYDNLEQLTEDSTLVIYGRLEQSTEEPIEDDSIYAGNNAFVDSRFQIEEIIYGDAPNDDTITIRDLSSGDHLLGGVPFYEDDANYILFLIKEEGHHHILGAYQGRFVIREGHVFQQTLEDIQLEDYQPLVYEDFKAALPTN